MGRKKTKYRIGDKVGSSVLAGNYRTDLIGGRMRGVATFICSYCGNNFDCLVDNVKRGSTTSCGCFAKKVSSEVHTRHGMALSREYNSWKGMRDRCNNKNNKQYDIYGGCGFKVDPRWDSSFEEFLKDMGKAPSPYHTIDRYPNQKGNYELGNCRWATSEQQNNNKSNNRVVEYNGESKTLMQWSKSLNISYQALQQRLNKKWPLEDVFTVPVIRGAANRWRNYKKEKI